jgi:hypothetical protein
MRGRAHFFISLIILFGATAAPAAIRTWIGGAGNNMSVPANWAEGSAPVSGDELIFPSTAVFRTPKCDLPADTVLQSLTFDGGYNLGDGGCRTRSLTTVGDLQLGPFPWAAPWVIEERLVVTSGSMRATIALGGPLVDMNVNGEAWLNLGNSIAGSSVVKAGTGYLHFSLQGDHLASVTALEGEMTVQGGAVDDVVVAGGHVHTGEITGSTITTAGKSSVIWARSHSVTRLGITDGAQFEILGCPSAFVTAEPPVLTGAALYFPNAASCPGTNDRILISNTSAEPVVGQFVGVPEGTVLSVGGRRFKITYRGGDGNDVQILAVPAVQYDFDADGRSDLSVFRPSDGLWYVQNEAGTTAKQWGQSSDRLAPGDYDGDGKIDYAVYRPSEGAWYIRYSYQQYWSPTGFGAPDDIPVPADFDGDGRTDIAVFRPSAGRWWLKSSLNSAPGDGVTTVQFGRAGDIPLPSDYDGDGMADMAVFRPENATWYIRNSSGGASIIPWGLTAQPHLPADRPVPADYDGDGRTDVAVFRPWEGNWHIILTSTQSPSIVNWGVFSDQPVPADYDGDGRADVAIFRPQDGNWWINQTTAGVTVQQFGTSEDRPVAAAFIQ